MCLISEDINSLEGSALPSDALIKKVIPFMKLGYEQHKSDKWATKPSTASKNHVSPNSRALVILGHRT